MSTPKSSSTSKRLSADDRSATRTDAAAKPVTYTYDRRRYVIDVLLPNYV